MLKLDGVSVFYDGIHALQGVSFEVPDGKIVSLIGANGAGKSTTLKSIVGLVKPAAGKIFWNNAELTGLATKDIVGQGIVLVPEGRRIFPNLTVEENLLLGAYSRKDKDGVKKDHSMVLDFFPRLSERLKQIAVGRGLMTRPKLFMLDEPSLGLAPLIVKMIFEIIREINKGGTTVLLVEQNAHAALEVADYGYVLETGAISFSGTGADLLKDDRVRQAYLGES